MTFNDLPIRRKLLLIVLLAIVVAGMTQSFLVLQYEKTKVREELSTELRALTLITAQRSGAALLFQDRKAVVDNLTVLLIQQNVELACVYLADRTEFANVSREGVAPEISCPEMDQTAGKELTGYSQFLENAVQVMEPIQVRDRSVGFLLIRANLDSVQARYQQYLVVSLIVALFSSAFAYLVTIRLTRSISRPILELAQVSAKIQETEDYSLRARQYSADETGQLVDNFNAMITATQHARYRLNALVLELQERAHQIQAHADKISERHDAIRDFFSGVSHDLRQPLQAIDLYVSVLKNSSDPGEREKIYDKLKQSVMSLGNLFRELLDVARFEAQVEKKVALSGFDLAELVRRLEQDFMVLAAEKNLRFKVSIKSCRILSNPTMLERVIRNILSNAIRYTDEGGVVLSMRLRTKEVWLEIWDSGRGIPDDKQDEVFHQFVQARQDDSAKGHGLGLSIVKRLLVALEYPLELKSRVGRGTLFRIKIPRELHFIEPGANEERSIELRLEQTPSIGESSDVKSEEPGIEAVQAQVTALSKALQILLIDDDPMVLDSVSMLLRSWDMRVTSCSSPVGALAWSRQAGQEPPSLIISDYNLSPNETGTDLVETLRLHWGYEVPSIIISGNEDAELIQRIKQNGYQLLNKPIKPAKLRAMINFLITQNTDA